MFDKKLRKIDYKMITTSGTKMTIICRWENQKKNAKLRNPNLYFEVKAVEFVSIEFAGSRLIGLMFLSPCYLSNSFRKIRCCDCVIAADAVVVFERLLSKLKKNALNVPKKIIFPWSSLHNIYTYTQRSTLVQS